MPLIKVTVEYADGNRYEMRKMILESEWDRIHGGTDFLLPELDAHHGTGAGRIVTAAIDAIDTEIEKLGIEGSSYWDDRYE